MCNSEGLGRAPKLVSERSGGASLRLRGRKDGLRGAVEAEGEEIVTRKRRVCNRSGHYIKGFSSSSRFSDRDRGEFSVKLLPCVLRWERLGAVGRGDGRRRKELSKHRS